jgi:hypothetical protein
MQTSVNDLKYVFVYRNIRTKTYSIKDMKSGLVIDRRDSGFLIQAAELIVSKAGRDRVLREKVKNVHAGVRGYLIENIPDDIIEKTTKVQLYYNPYTCSSFKRMDNNCDIKSCSIVLFKSNGIFGIDLDEIY